MHWTKTSRLVFAHSRAAELHMALQNLGAKGTAERLREWMNKQELKFNLMSFDGPPAEEIPPLGPGKAESRPKPSRKRPRSAMPRGKHCETKSTKSGEASAAPGTARLFAKVQNVQSLADRQSELKATDASNTSNTSNTSNGLVAVSNEAKVIDSSLPNFGGKESLAAAPAEAAVPTEPKEQGRDGQEDSDRIQSPIAESNEAEAEPMKSKKQKCGPDGTSILSLLISGSKAQDQSLATAPTSQSSEGMENTFSGKTCDEPGDTHSDVPMSSIESRPEGRMPATPMQNGDSNPRDQDKTKPESGTRMQPGGHVMLVLGNQQHRQKSLRSMFGRGG